MRRLLATVVLAVAAATLAPARAEGRAHAESAHYTFSTSGSQGEADEWVRMLEAAYPHYAEFFDATPKLGKDERLAVMLFDDEDAWRQAIRDGGGSPPGAAGYYCPVAKTAYLKRQPSVWYTRTLLLHEAAHQYHYLARTGNDAPAANWYVEGVAEHLGSHTWDGETLRVGVTPLVSLEDRAGDALTEISADGFSLADLVDAKTASRPAAMFLVRYLAEQEPKRFAGIAKKLDRGSRLDAKGFRRAFGKADALVEDWRTWLEARQEPLVSVFVEWDTRADDTVHATAKVVSLCRTREAVSSLSATIERSGDRPLRAGVIAAFGSTSDYTIAVVDERSGTAHLHVDRMAEGRWRRLYDVPLGDPSPDGWIVACGRSKDGVSVSATRAGEAAAAGEAGPVAAGDATPLGLALDACDATFTDLEWE